MASFPVANEWQLWWPVPQLRFELNQACEKLRLVTGYLHREKHYSAYLQGELERFQAHHHKSLKDLLEWQKERDWQATCALRKKEEELSSLQRRCARKHEAENPTCNGVSLDEFKTQMVRKYMDENQQLLLKVEQLEMKLTENQGEDFCIGKLVEEEASPKASTETEELSESLGSPCAPTRRQGRPSDASRASMAEPPDQESTEKDELDKKEEDLGEQDHFQPGSCGFESNKNGEMPFASPSSSQRSTTCPSSPDPFCAPSPGRSDQSSTSDEEASSGDEVSKPQERSHQFPESLTKNPWATDTPEGSDQQSQRFNRQVVRKFMDSSKGDELEEREEDLAEEDLKASSQVLPGKCKPCGWSSLCSELRFEISSYLAVPSLCAARATSREGSSTEAFVASVVQLLEPRLSVFMACGDLYTSGILLDKDKKMEHMRALAEKNFQLFAGVQGFRCLFFAKETTVKRWWDTSQLALIGVVKSLVQRSSEMLIRGLLLMLVRVSFRHCYDRGYKRFLAEQLFAVLCHCTKRQLRHACNSFAELANHCQDPCLAKPCIEALAEVWHQLCQDPPELKEPAIRALAAWTTNFPEHYERIRDMGVTL